MKRFPALCVHSDKPAQHADVVLRTRLRLSRNVSGVPFPAAMDGTSLEATLAHLKTAVQSAGMFVSTRSELDESLTDRLAAMELMPRSYLVNDQALVALSESDAVWASFCTSDHLVLESAQAGLNLVDSYRALDETDNRIASALTASGLSWAFHPDAGFIMPDALRCGSGLCASISLHLPALVMSALAEQAFKRAMDAGFIIEGAYAARSSSLGSVFGLSLPQAWRESEAQALERLGRAALAMVEYERRCRDELMKTTPVDVLDAVGRALGLVSNARSLSRDEAVESLSMLRLGAAVGVLAGLELAELDELWLLAKTRMQVRDGERDAQARARLLRLAVQGATIESRYRDV